MRTGAAAWMLVTVLAAPPAAADECQLGWTVSLDVPRDGAAVRPNVRFRVLEVQGCSSVNGGPRHQLRLQDGAGNEIPSDAATWASHYIELTPRAPLVPGAAALWVRRPVGEAELGPWEPLSRVTVAGEADTTAPVFEGLVAGEARAIEGSVRWSPCENVPGWELETRLRFPAARDAESGPDDLLYHLERSRPLEGKWEGVTTLRPSPDGDMMAFTWKREEGWGESWVYRMSARDMAGHEAVGAREVTVQSPPRPERELWTPPGAAPEVGAPEMLKASPGRCQCRGVVGGDAGEGWWAVTLLAPAGVAAMRRRGKQGR